MFQWRLSGAFALRSDVPGGPERSDRRALWNSPGVSAPTGANRRLGTALNREEGRTDAYANR